MAEARWGEIDDAGLKSALDDLQVRLRVRFGDRFVKLILFGSRARGDHRPDSDADVAVILRGPIADRWAIKVAILGDTYPILLRTGLYIQPWPIEEQALDDPSSAPNPGLIRNILQEGVWTSV